MTIDLDALLALADEAGNNSTLGLPNDNTIALCNAVKALIARVRAAEKEADGSRVLERLTAAEAVCTAAEELRAMLDDEYGMDKLPLTYVRSTLADWRRTSEADREQV